MVRPSANTLISTNVTDFLSIDILEATSLYAVVYKNKPFNLRQRYWSAQGEMIKYIRSSYPNQAPAENLAAKLNKEFLTTEFTVKKVI